MSSKMGRPKIDNPNNIKKSFMLNRELLDKVEAHRKENSLSFGEVVRRALKMYLK